MRQQVWQDVHQQDARPSGAERAGRLDELELDQRAGLRVDDARVCTQFTSAMTRATIHKLGLRMAASAMASSSAGNAIIRSVKRMMTVPTQPPA